MALDLSHYFHLLRRNHFRSLVLGLDFNLPRNRLLLFHSRLSWTVGVPRCRSDVRKLSYLWLITDVSLKRESANRDTINSCGRLHFRSWCLSFFESYIINLHLLRLPPLLNDLRNSFLFLSLCQCHSHWLLLFRFLFSRLSLISFLFLNSFLFFFSICILLSFSLFLLSKFLLSLDQPHLSHPR